MSKFILSFCIFTWLIVWAVSGQLIHHKPAWGFFGHRKINRHAVFTLPPQMVIFFKKNIEYLTEHAVDADMRRYATRFEAPRHFLDLNRYGKTPFPELPRRWPDAITRHSEWFFVSENYDTLKLFDLPADSVFKHLEMDVQLNPVLAKGKDKSLKASELRSFFIRNFLPKYYDDAMTAPCDSLAVLLGSDDLNCRSVWVKDGFSEHGILPYNLERTFNHLTDAMRERNARKILRHAADIGHYIADAHVPLHTTSNYNGQLTGQNGIHAFWESRLPELYADAQYDYLTGQAVLVENPQEFFWNIILESHSLVDSVLAVELGLRHEFPPDHQMCNEYRGDAVLRTQCEEFADAYHRRLGGMVEYRMRAAMLAVGSAWYTAWVNAGQPDLDDLESGGVMENQQEKDSLERAFKSGNILGRPH